MIQWTDTSFSLNFLVTTPFTNSCLTIGFTWCIETTRRDAENRPNIQILFSDHLILPANKMVFSSISNYTASDIQYKLYGVTMMFILDVISLIQVFSCNWLRGCCCRVKKLSLVSGIQFQCHPTVHIAQYLQQTFWRSLRLNNIKFNSLYKSM